MNKTIDDPTSIIGKKIKNVTSKVTDVEPNTGQETFRYLVQLSNDVTLAMLPGEILCSDDLAGDGHPAKLQVIDGAPDLAGEEIVGVITRDLSPPTAEYYRNFANPRYLALILSSGRAAMNVYRCGGGTVLHVEAVNGLMDNFGKDWRDFWTDESVEFEKLYSRRQ